MNPPILITGIGTDVGKTIISAIVCESLKADYWKPIQAGELPGGDTETVKSLVSNAKTAYHPNCYALTTAASPHWAAELDEININLQNIRLPKTKNRLVIEGAGGLLVPFNNDKTMLDLIKPHYKVIVVSRHYLGSINHTLMTLNILHQHNIQASVIFNGNENKSSEDIIKKQGNTPIIGRINEENIVNPEIIRFYAKIFNTQLMNL